MVSVSGVYRTKKSRTFESSSRFVDFDFHFFNPTKSRLKFDFFSTFFDFHFFCSLFFYRLLSTFPSKVEKSKQNFDILQPSTGRGCKMQCSQVSSTDYSKSRPSCTCSCFADTISRLLSSTYVIFHLDSRNLEYSIASLSKLVVFVGRPISEF